MRDFRQLHIWSLGKEIVKSVYLLIEALPLNEKYGISSQISRAAISIPSNIAEGCSRKSEKDTARFFEIALGSAYELETQLIIVKELGLNKEFVIDELIKMVIEEEKMIGAFINRFGL
jgi:four helix bundle protein